MKFSFLLFLTLIFSVHISLAQVRPPDPSPCVDNGPNNKNNNLTVTGNTTFTFSNASDFDISQASSSITVNVMSSNQYRLYIAGEISYSGTLPNTPIPLNTFTISASNRGTSPVSIPLSGSYQEIAEANNKKGVNHVLTITRLPLPDFTQAPGTHTLTLHFRFCQY
ncbi:MAG TPA: hypothetical protein VEV16_05335 [Daejeonella sp.]|nr:hypothetical protein [Daejeonella sp.]